MKSRTKEALYEYAGNLLGVLVVCAFTAGVISIIHWIKEGFR